MLRVADINDKARTGQRPSAEGRELGEVPAQVQVQEYQST